MTLDQRLYYYYWPHSLPINFKPYLHILAHSRCGEYLYHTILNMLVHHYYLRVLLSSPCLSEVACVLVSRM